MAWRTRLVYSLIVGYRLMISNYFGAPRSHINRGSYYKASSKLHSMIWQCNRVFVDLLGPPKLNIAYGGGGGGGGGSKPLVFCLYFCAWFEDSFIWLYWTHLCCHLVDCIKDGRFRAGSQAESSAAESWWRDSTCKGITVCLCRVQRVLHSRDQRIQKSLPKVSPKQVHAHPHIKCKNALKLYIFERVSMCNPAPYCLCWNGWVAHFFPFIVAIYSQCGLFLLWRWFLFASLLCSH